MPQGTVQAIGKSRSGKPTVTVDGQIYSASKVDLSGMQVGDRIEMDTASSDYNGAKIWFLNGYKLLQAAQKYPPHQQAQTPISAPTQPVGASSGVSEPERIFAYGVVTEAIKASLVKDRVDLGLWACAAVHAIRFAGTDWPDGDLGKRLGEFLDKSHGS